MRPVQQRNAVNEVIFLDSRISQKINVSNA